MEKSIITFSANEQNLQKTGGIGCYASDTVSYIEAHFALGENWSGYDSIRAVWSNDYKTISTVLDSDGVCIVPHEVLVNRGKVMVNLVGSVLASDELSDRLTTFPCEAVKVTAKAKIEGSETQPITPSQFEQYVAIVQALVGSVRDIDHIVLNDDYTLTIYYSDGTSDTTSSIRGATGNGIASIAKTGTSGSNPVVDTYTVTYTDGNTFAFTVTNGKKGDKGDKGETGNGIASIDLTSTSGAVKTYTITFTDGTTTTFEVTDGEVTNASMKAYVDPQFADLKSELNRVVDFYNDIEPYLYKRNTYINGTTETTLNGYDLYKIPVKTGDLVSLKQMDASNMFYGGLGAEYALHYEVNSAYVAIVPDGTGSSHPLYYFASNRGNFLQRNFFAIADTDVTALMISVKNGNENYVRMNINSNTIDIADNKALRYYNSVYDITEENSIIGSAYKGASAVVNVYTSGYSIRSHEVKEGDTVVIPRTATGINALGYFINKSTLLSSEILTNTYTAPADGYVQTFWYTGDADIKVTVYPKNSLKLEYANLVNVPDSENPYFGLDGVAFGTSITYRALSTYGYLQYLPTLSEMTWDNQGVGSSEILSDLLAKVKSYASYNDKDVCILEGFVNDWYQGNPLGTYTDDTETTVCGCVRSAINYIYSQNANITVFLVLDQYGKLANSVDCRSTALNPNSLTQYEFYEECAKVAESMGVPVIKLYADGQISQNTPQYLNDNIHPTALGAKQSAYVIWAGMKQHFPNQKTQ